MRSCQPLAMAKHAVPAGNGEDHSTGGVDCGHLNMRRTRCWKRKNALGRTAANRAGRVVLTRYTGTQKVRLSEHPAAGNPAGKMFARFRKTA